MCPFKLLVLLSTLPVEMAIAGQHEQEAEFTARKNSLASGQPVHAIANLMRTLGRKNSSFTALGTLAVTLVLGYLITRCFIAMASRTKRERGTVSRRLASGADYVCFEEEEARTRTEQPAWRKLLKPAIFVGAGAIVGVTMGAGITEGVMKQEMKGQLQLLDQIKKLSNFLPLLPPPARTKTLTRHFPRKTEFKVNSKRRVNVPLTAVNERLANCFVALSEHNDEDKLIKKLTKFAKYLIREAVGARVGQENPETQKTADEFTKKLQTEYTTSVTAMVKENKPNEKAKTNEKAKALMRYLKDDLEHEIEINSKGSKGTVRVPLEDLNKDVISYLLRLWATGKKKTDIITELSLFANPFINEVAAKPFEEDPSKAQALQVLAHNLQTQYKNEIMRMVKDEEAIKAAIREAAIRECASHYAKQQEKHVSPIVKRTVDAIQAGTFKLD